MTTRIADPNLRCPLTICRWISLFRAIRLLDETARERKLPPVAFNDGTYGALCSFIENYHGRLLNANFPKWNRRSLLPTAPKITDQPVKIYRNNNQHTKNRKP